MGDFFMVTTSFASSPNVTKALVLVPSVIGQMGGLSGRSPLALVASWASCLPSNFYKILHGLEPFIGLTGRDAPAHDKA